MDKYIAFIPVRGGSKSIPLKNIKLIHGRPLVYWTLDAAVQCPRIDKVYVYTDSSEIKDSIQYYIGRNSCNKKLFYVDRPEETATDTATTESAMIAFSQEHPDFLHMILIQATSPLLNSSDLSSAIEMYEKGIYDSLLSVVRQKRFLWEKLKDKYVPSNYDFHKRPRRQDFSGYIVENGAFYINSRNNILENSCRLSGSVGAYEMHDDSFVEIDEPSDWLIVEKLLEKHFQENKRRSIQERARKVKMLLTDCDGVLTDGGMYYSESGEESKRFNTRDGMGIQLLHDAGMFFGIITGENSNAVRNRAKKLKAEECYVGISNKVEILNKICKKYKISYNEIAYIGDDLNDIGVMKLVGLPCSVSDGLEKVKAQCLFVTKNKGGHGAVREVIEFLLEQK